MKKETIATHYGYNQKNDIGAMAVPIYLTTAFDFGTSERAADRFCLKDLGPIYSRLTNPTVDVLESRLAKLEGGSAALAVSSGQAATFTAIINLAGAGDNIIVAEKVYGGTATLTMHSLKRFGIEARLFDSENPQNLRDLIDEKTKCIFFETISNPQISIANIDEIVKIAKEFNIVTIADNTVATPILYNPLKDGVDVVVHSASKYISGQGLSIAGAVVASKELNQKLKANPRYEHFNTPDESYHGLVYADLVDSFDIFILRAKFGILRDFGMTLSPFNAFQLIQGLETLSIRVKKHSKNAKKVAKFLQNHPKVKRVIYPALKEQNGYDIVKSKFKDGMASGLLAFELEDFESAKKVSNKVEIFSVVVNIGDTKSIITHPASTTHSQLSKEELENSGISQGLIRLSIGLENAKDLIKDLEQALEEI
ncbi:O-acetylhomoserine sulfhydrylase [Campylobacter blaseri]|uniref:O-acetylhomoserine aminocarboxypropyltransferase n=1 Tax=Campylobacter blaseri TaxID=2042961 RepID=A0A2P8QZL1_9BACT|nr:O-acetylhomoserine aminocarboxypropyltransferase/cysteine synthase family protein [Campylobacter blaseri]PSM51681.1 O-acetylhomoserine aminocarboxypropyltransferase [Campylobacter blaseri]PSM53471.1 O-acetylhomoserine aminocarboxypropyltransferase [Campylobacter blaseri]QKF86276.1 O-acetylhomoserine sulfhydrylase [Campylobacter blaseri]